MNSEQLGALIADVLRGSGRRTTHGPWAHVPVRRARPAGDGDLVTGGWVAVPEDQRRRVRGALERHPDVTRAEVEGDALVVWVTDESRREALRDALRTVPDADLRAPRREVVLSDRPGRWSAAEAAAVVGEDVVAYELARTHRPGPGGQPLRLDVDEVLRRTPDAPLFRVQYAHARAAALTVRAEEVGVPAVGNNGTPWGRREPAGRLAASLVELPATVARAVRRHELGPVPRHLEEIAGLLLDLEPERRFLPGVDEVATEVHSSGVLLVAAAEQLTDRVLGMLGVGAPTRI